LDELKLNGIDTSAFLSPVDLTLGSIERNLQIAAVLGGLSISAALELSQLQILFLVLGLLSLWSVDFVSNLPLSLKKNISSDFMKDIGLHYCS